jgi:hypothetical protein
MGTNGGVVLPEPGQRNILVTSALPYVNNVPHLGNSTHPSMHTVCLTYVVSGSYFDEMG